MDVVLIAGLWLEESVWDAVGQRLEAHGHRAVPVALPGQGDGDVSARLADQVAAVLAAIDATAGKPLVVGHSAACSLAWSAADARPDKVGAVALIGGFPAADGERYADFFPVRDGVMAFPGWDRFEGPDSADLDDSTKQAFAAAAHPVPEGVSTGVVALTDERRHGVPVIVVCPEFTPTQAKALIDGGDVPELAKVERLAFVDIDSGHWPMISAPDELARILSEAAENQQS